MTLRRHIHAFCVTVQGGSPPTDWPRARCECGEWADIEISKKDPPMLPRFKLFRWMPG